MTKNGVEIHSIFIEIDKKGHFLTFQLVYAIL
jgi:hypothetical protein